MKKRILQIVFLGLIIIVAVGCGTRDKADEPIVFASEAWASDKFYNEVAQFIIENGYGYETESVSGTTVAFLTGMEKNEVDVHMEFWSKNQGPSYQEALDNGDFQLLSINFDDNKQGFYVPTYVIEGDPERDIKPMAPDLKYISDLPKYWELFEDPDDPSKGRVHGWIIGGETDDSLIEAFEYYELDETFNYFHPGSETALNTSIVDAHEDGDAWVGYSYDPHWIMGTYDMTLLEEKEKSDALENLDSQEIHIIASNSLVDRAPDVKDFLSQFTTSSDVANDALTFIEENEATEYEAAIHFLENNESMWSEWIPNGVAEKVKNALDDAT